MYEFDEYQLGIVDGVPRAVMEAESTVSLESITEGVDTSQLVPSDGSTALPSTGWRPLRDRTENLNYSVWAAPVTDSELWWVMIISYRDPERPSAGVGFDPVRPLPARRIRRHGLELRWSNTHEVVGINELRSHRFEFDLLNVSDRRWLNVAEDSVCMEIWPILDVPVFVMSGTDHLLPNLEPGESVRLSGACQYDTLEPGEYRLRAVLATLGLAASRDGRLSLR